ncbi:snRNA-activating protein complex subunit 3 isoform X2 [Harpegnathos saltator]|nr:snRNA-activating protein complex subunit 3 isoform X2 [Harpegnathos saltator]
MDKVYGCYNHQASSQICLKDYFLEYSKLLQSTIYYEENQSTEEKMFHLMGIELSEARLNLMSHYCSVNNLRMETTNDDESEDKKLDKHLENISDSTNLETLKVLKKYNNTLLQKYYTQNGIPIVHEKLSNEVKTIKPGSDFLVYVQVYEPFNSSIQRSGKYFKPNFPTLRMKYVISILGCQYLTELREKITCVSDMSIATEISENPDEQIENLAKNVYKSGFFFIENTFYNDMRDANNVNYSDVILKWANTRDKIGPFKTARMENVRIDSLCARFGFPWVYMHQGSCEHLIVLSDARLVTENDDLSTSVYPKIEKIKPIPGKNCLMCGLLNVRWILTEHNRIPHDTSYFCENCFRSYNYINNIKVGNFKAYRYPCIPELMRENKRNK